MLILVVNNINTMWFKKNSNMEVLMKIKKILVVILLGCITTTVFAQFSIDLKKTAGSILGNDKKDAPAKATANESPSQVNTDKANDLAQPKTGEVQKITGKADHVKEKAVEPQKADVKGNAYKTLNFGDDLKTIGDRLDKLNLDSNHFNKLDHPNDYSKDYYLSLPEENVRLVDEFLKKNIKAGTCIPKFVTVKLRDDGSDNKGLGYYYGWGDKFKINEQSSLYLEAYPNYGLCHVEITFSYDFDTSLLYNKIQEDNELKETESANKIYRIYEIVFGLKDNVHLPFELDVPYKKYTKTDKNGVYHEYVVYDFEKAEFKESKDETIKKILADEENLVMKMLEEAKRKKPELKIVTREEWRKGLISDFGKDTDFRKYAEGKLQEIKQKKYDRMKSKGFFSNDSTLYTSYYLKSYKLEEAREYLKKNFEELKKKAIDAANNMKNEKAKQAVDF